MKKLLFPILIVLLIAQPRLSTSLFLRSYPLKNLKKVNLKVNHKELELWVMDTFLKRQEGMMFLEYNDIKPSQGMIFIHPKPIKLTYWMKNTLIPLDIIYLDSKGKILNIEALKPLCLDGVSSKGLAKYAIELKSGTCRNLGIKPNMILKIPRNIKAIH